MMEASMNGSLDNQARDGRSAYRNWNMKLIALTILGVVAMIAFVISHPGASKFISDAAQAEFVGTEFVPDIAPPTQLAQPNKQIRTVKVY
jgi:hypothetical protein